MLGDLPRAEYAGFNSFRKNGPPPECLEGTRSDILSQIEDWGNANSDEYMFWLSGMAGTGKSTIARTVARRFHQKGCLGASFFFSRGQKDLSDATKLFATLAVQLAKALPDLKPHICDAITKYDGIWEQSLPDQWKQLIFQPLLMLEENLLLSLALVFVIDALDECEGDQDLPVILELLKEVKNLKKIRVQVFITSRPEESIRCGFRKIPGIFHYDLMLHSIPRSVVQHDISILIKHELVKIKEDKYLGGDWPGEERIQKLVQKADRLFIYAATACRFIGESRYPEKRLSEMLQVNSAGHSSTKELDDMYTLILKHSIIEGHDEDNEDMARLFKRIVGSVIVLFDILSTNTLTELLEESLTDVKLTLEPLHSVLDISQNETSPIQLFHLSFRDFLLDKKRCPDQFWVDEKMTHYDLFVCCLKLMSKHLGRDMCDLRLPGALATEVEKGVIERCLPLEIQYACLYWVEHLQRSDAQLHDDDQVHQFLQENLLYWLEALSLMGKTSEGVIAITSLESYILVSHVCRVLENPTNQ